MIGRSTRFLTLASLLLVPALSHAAAARSLSYTAEYLVVGSGGAAASSSSYSIVEQIKTSGVAVAAASSVNYSLRPAIDAEEVPEVSAVVDWSLY